MRCRRAASRSRPRSSMPSSTTGRERAVTAVLREPALPPMVDVRGRPPVEPNTIAEVDGRLVAWLGPDEWLVFGATEADHPGVDAAVDVSAARICFELSGAGGADVLAQGCSLDLDTLTPGRCAQTLLARVQVLLLR